MLTKEEKQLKEAMKILLRDGKNGKFFEIAKTRYLALKTAERINNFAHEINGVDWTDNFRTDIAKIEQIIK